MQVEKGEGGTESGETDKDDLVTGMDGLKV